MPPPTYRQHDVQAGTVEDGGGATQCLQKDQKGGNQKEFPPWIWVWGLSLLTAIQTTGGPLFIGMAMLNSKLRFIWNVLKIPLLPISDLLICPLIQNSLNSKEFCLFFWTKREVLVQALVEHVGWTCDVGWTWGSRSSNNHGSNGGTSFFCSSWERSHLVWRRFTGTLVCGTSGCQRSVELYDACLLRCTPSCSTKLTFRHIFVFCLV